MTLGVSVADIVEKSNNPLLKIHPSWQRVLLGDIAEILNGFAFESSKFSKDKGYPLLRIRDIGDTKTQAFYTGDFDKAYIVKPGDLVIGMDGDFNCAKWAGEPALLNQRVCKVTIKSTDYNPNFLYYVLPGYLKAINDHTSSVTVKHLSSRTVSEIPLPFPPLPEQERIVAKIEELFTQLEAGTSALERVQIALQRYKDAVLNTAINGQLVRQNPSDTSAHLLLRNIHKERVHKWELIVNSSSQKKKPENYKEPESIDESTLPSLPQGWVWATLDQIAQEGRPIIYGIIKPGPHIPDGVPYVRVTEMKNGHINVNELKKTSVERAKKFARATLAEGDLLISKDGTIGRVAVVPPELVGGNITQHVMRAPIHSFMDRNYVVWAVRSPFCQRWLKGETKGVALQGVNVEDFRRLPIPVPPLEEQRRIVAEVERRLSVAREVESVVEKALARSARLRQAVLKFAFEGKLT